MNHDTERGNPEERYEDDWNRSRGRMRGDYNREGGAGNENDWSRREYGDYGSQGQGYQSQGEYGNYGRRGSNDYDNFGRDYGGGSWQTGYDQEGRYGGQQRGRDYGGSWMTGYGREGRYGNQGGSGRDYGYGRDYGGSWQTGYDPEGRYRGQRNRDYGGSWMTGYGREDRYGNQESYGRDYGDNWQAGYGNEGPQGQGWGSDYGRGSYGNAWQSGRRQDRWQEGPYSGRGPSGYQRSDERIREDAHECLTRHGWLDASNVQVDVNDGTVTLKGTVADRRAKRMAEDALDEVSGIRDVQNQIQVKPQNEGNNEWQGNQSQNQGQTKKKQATA